MGVRFFINLLVILQLLWLGLVLRHRLLSISAPQGRELAAAETSPVSVSPSSTASSSLSAPSVPPPAPPPRKTPRPTGKPSAAPTVSPTVDASVAAMRRRRVAAICKSYPRACQCAPIDPEVIVYNRIPKAGSGSMNIFLGEARDHGMPFELCMSRMYHDRLLRGERARRYAHNPISASGCRQTGKQPRTVLSRHVFYLNFSAYGRDGMDPAHVAHMNVMRDPVSRCVSRFYYERDARGTFPHEMTLDECMAPNGRCKFEEWQETESAALRGFQRFRQFREECASNYLSRWFCGMGEECHEDGVRSRVLLERAKDTVAEGYTFVGLTSEMKTNFEVLKTLLPAYFANDEIPVDICNKCKKPEDVAREAAAKEKEAAERETATMATSSGRTSHPLQRHDTPAHDPAVSPPTPPVVPRKVSTENEARIAALNALDMELYEFVVDLFWAKATACLGANVTSASVTTAPVAAAEQQQHERQ